MLERESVASARRRCACKEAMLLPILIDINFTHKFPLPVPRSTRRGEVGSGNNHTVNMSARKTDFLKGKSGGMREELKKGRENLSIKAKALEMH